MHKILKIQIQTVLLDPQRVRQIKTGQTNMHVLKEVVMDSVVHTLKRRLGVAVEIRIFCANADQL